MKVYAVYGVSEEEYFEHLNRTLDIEPDIIVDDGGDLLQIIHTTRRDLADRIIAGCEETTTGVKRMELLSAKGELLFPMIAVNDARSKHLFDNRYGTGQSTLTAILATTNLLLAGKTVVVAGYGMCGKGVAKRAIGMGANVVVTEIDPVCAAEAIMDGCKVMSMDDAATVGDLFITVTGCIDVITKDHFLKMKEGVISLREWHPGNARFRRRLKLTGLKDATVRVYTEPGRECSIIHYNQEWINIDFVDTKMATDAYGTYIEAEHLSGDFCILIGHDGTL
jgi:adenosylhomocysteinase